MDCPWGWVCRRAGRGLPRGKGIRKHPCHSYLVFWMVDTSLLREDSFFFRSHRTETKNTKFTCRNNTEYKLKSSMASTSKTHGFTTGA